jgi:hypothetical protein
MPGDKQPLDIDLSFLDEKARQEAPPPVDTGYKLNWKNIALFVVIALAIGVIVIANESSTTNSTPWTSQITTSSNPSPPLSHSDRPVTMGQYRCSQYDAGQADQRKPSGSAALAAVRFSFTNANPERVGAFISFQVANSLKRFRPLGRQDGTFFD